MIARTLVFLFLLMPSSSFGLVLRDGGEIGNAFVPFESLLGGYSLQYPQSWRYNELANTTSFSDPGASSPDQASFLSVLTDRFENVRSLEDLRRFLAFFHPDESWESVEVAGLPGFVNRRSPRIYYLYRGEENLISIRARSTEGEKSDRLLEAMLRSLWVK